MIKNAKGLSPLYLRALLGRESFVKSINPGTGLGKTFSAFDATSLYLSQNPSPHVFIYVAPQHQHISIDPAARKKLEEMDCEVINVRPVSSAALSNIESETNAHQIAKDLLYTQQGRQNSLFKALETITKRLDRKVKNQTEGKRNAILLHPRLLGIVSAVSTIDAELRRNTPFVPSEKTYENGEDDATQEINDELNKERRRLEMELSTLRITTSLALLSKNLTSLLEYSYSHPPFFQAIEGAGKAISAAQYKKLRDTSASFFPFLHVQKSDKPYSLLLMTVAKMLTNHKVFRPRFEKGRVRWGKRDVKISEIMTDKSELTLDALDAMQKTPAQFLPEHQNSFRLYQSNFVTFIDESDDSKGIIMEELTNELQDLGVIPAIGALAKEVGDVVGNYDHVPIVEHIEKSVSPTLLGALDAMHNNDSLARINAKEQLRDIRGKIYDSLLQNKWVFADESDTIESFFEKTNIVLNGALTAPFCTVMQSMDSDVFKSTSAFGGEMYGFTGSSHMRDLCFMNMGNSFSIMTNDEAKTYPDHFARVPLAYFFLLLSEAFLYFRLISKDRGSPTQDLKDEEAINEFIASNDDNGLTDHLSKFYRRTRGALSGIGAPFRSPNRDNTPESPTNLHTKAAEDTIKMVKREVTKKAFQNAFSDGKELSELIDNDSQSFSAPKALPIDLHFANQKAHTVYGMTQVHDGRYLLSRNRTNVAFPIVFRAQSPEQFIVDLVDTEQRRNGVFLISATGGFTASHVSAFSLESLQMLIEQQTCATFLTMTPDDYKCIAQRKAERGAEKTLHIKRIEDDLASIPAHSLLRWHGSEPVGNKHKISELDNISHALHHINTQTKPSFALAIAQTHRHFTRNLLSLPPQHAITAKETERVRILLRSDNADLENSETKRFHQASYAIALVENASGPSTLVISYSAALERTLKKLLRSTDKNPNRDENRLKEVLGFEAGQVPPGANAHDTNPMDYILTEAHGHHVLIVSAYQSAARGINLIVNNQMGKRKQRDLDAMFICAPPFYSELIIQLEKDTLHYYEAQNYYFHQCRKYFYRIEELARQAQRTGQAPLSSEKVDLFIAEGDPIQRYFSDQHKIELMTTLVQTKGRCERTSAKQTQFLYVCEGVADIINAGREVVERGLSNAEKVNITNGLSVVNTKLFEHVQASPSTSSYVATPSAYASNEKLFNNIKNELLTQCVAYREATSQTMLALVKPYIDFYEALRSSVLWTDGANAYLAQLRHAIERIPASRQAKYAAFIEQLFIETKEIAEDELLARYSEKRNAVVSPYQLVDPKTKVARYVSPWFLPDVEGNYGELVVDKSIDQLLLNNANRDSRFGRPTGIEVLSPHECEATRRCYELADRFLRCGDQIVAVDAKYYRYIKAFYEPIGYGKKEASVSRPENKIQLIQAAFQDVSPLPVRLVTINTHSASDKRKSGIVKSHYDFYGQKVPDVLSFDVGDSLAAISVHLRETLEFKESAIYEY